MDTVKRRSGTSFRCVAPACIWTPTTRPGRGSWKPMPTGAISNTGCCAWTSIPRSRCAWCARVSRRLRGQTGRRNCGVPVGRVRGSLDRRTRGPALVAVRALRARDAAQRQPQHICEHPPHAPRRASFVRGSVQCVLETVSTWAMNAAFEIHSQCPLSRFTTVRRILR